MQAMDRDEVIQWRKAERQRLISQRLAISGDIRRHHADQIAASLDEVIGGVHGRVISAYWPFRGEPDLRGFMAGVLDRGGRCALPVVRERGKPLVFRLWSPGEPLADRACYRLGYGGGFFDLTLATMKNSPLKLGVGYPQQALLTIHPRPNDIPMDMVITEEGAWFPE